MRFGSLVLFALRNGCIMKMARPMGARMWSIGLAGHEPVRRKRPCVKVSAKTFGRISRGVGKGHRGDAGKLYEMMKARLVRAGASRPKCATVARRVGRPMECRGQGVEIYGEAPSACGELQWPAGELSVSETLKRQCRRTVPDFAALTPGYLLYRAVNMSPGRSRRGSGLVPRKTRIDSCQAPDTPDRSLTGATKVAFDPRKRSKEIDLIFDIETGHDGQL
jgi:hypothetical protein